MQIKEFEAFSLKDCLQQVRNDLGPDAVILETRKFRKGGILGLGARDAVCIVAATGITVKNDTLERPSERVTERAVPELSRPAVEAPRAAAGNGNGKSNGKASKAAVAETPTRYSPPVPPTQAAAVAAARNAYTRNNAASSERLRDTAPTALLDDEPRLPAREAEDFIAPRPRAASQPKAMLPMGETTNDQRPKSNARQSSPAAAPSTAFTGFTSEDAERIALLERAMQEIRDSLTALKQEQQEAHERTVSAVVSAVTPAMNAVSTVAGLSLDESLTQRLPELYERLRGAGISPELARELLDSLPDLSAWSAEAQLPLAESALRDLLSHRVHCAGPIVLTPGTLKAVALIGPTGVGKTTTIAKLAAHFALVEHKKVGLLTVDTYRIAAVEQLKTYSQIIDIPIAVAYNQGEVLPAIEQFADYDLLLIDTAGRSQKNIMQVGELKAMLEAVRCETHLVLSALIKTEDMLDAARRFSAARVDRLLFSKLDETSTYGTLIEVADKTGIPLSYLTTGQKVPEDIETADAANLVDLILS